MKCNWMDDNIDAEAHTVSAVDPLLPHPSWPPEITLPAHA